MTTTPATMREPLLHLQNVGRLYRMGEVDVHALREATLDIEDGEFLVVIGASGSGKSTLLNLIGGMDRPTSGTIHYRGQDITRFSDAQLTLFRRREVGFVFQFYNLIPSLTARENVEVATEIADDPLDADEVLEMVGMSDRAHHFPSQLSGGQQQRVAIARALAGNPRLLLCDEPTGALDSQTTAQIIELLRELNQTTRRTIALITHNPDLMHLGHRVAHLSDGRVMRIETVENGLSVAP